MQRHEKDYRRREMQQQQQPYRNREHEGREFGRDFDDYTEWLERRASETSRGEGSYQEGRGFYPRGFEGPRDWDRGFESRRRDEEMYDDRRFPERYRGGMLYGPYGEPGFENWRNRSFSQWEPSRGQQYRQFYGQPSYGQPQPLYGQPWMGRYSGEGYLRGEDEFEDDYGQNFGRGPNRFQRQGQGRMWGNQYGGGFVSSFQGPQMGQNSGRGPRGFTRSDDRIKEDIAERLTDHPELDATDLEIKVHNGEVTLTGTVSERWNRRLAEDLAESVSGVKQIQNQIRFQEEQQGSQSGRQGPGAETGSKRSQEHEAVGVRR
jgi:osmotically-inducible protein OsmY